MTLLWKSTTARPPGIPRTHALVIGVGSYPEAKPKRGFDETLRAVPDVASAADGAKLMCDWLQTNGNHLVAELDSLEVLISDVPDSKRRYVWQGMADVDRATLANVIAAGKRWVDRLRAQPGDTALLYVCGHGAYMESDPVIFCEDLNGDEYAPFAHLAIATIARDLQKMPEIGKAYVFVDACAEKVKDFEAGTRNKNSGKWFTPQPKFGAPTTFKVLLLCAVPEAGLAYDAPVAPGGPRIGRFTQVLTKTLDGAVTRPSGELWAVFANTLATDLKRVQQLHFGSFGDRPFEPAPVLPISEEWPIVFPPHPRVPIVLSVVPAEKAVNFKVGISGSKAVLPLPDSFRNAGVPPPLRINLEPTSEPLYAVAFDDALGCHNKCFVPDGPKYDLQVVIP